MKPRILIALIATCGCLHGQDNATALIAKGRMAEKTGDVTAARAAYTEALRLQPSNPHARYHLNELNRNAGKIAALGRQKKLESVKLPAVDFQRVELSEALEALTHLIEKQTKEKYSPNFLVNDPSGKFAGGEINLKLKEVPAKAVLDMILGQVGGKATYDQHAIVVSPH